MLRSAHDRLLEHPDHHDPNREIVDVTRKFSNIELDERSLLVKGEVSEPQQVAVTDK
jgi:hypothetical protein